MPKTNNNIKIRTASADDAPELLDIYKPYVEKTAISFEYQVPSTEEFRARLQKTLKKYPFLVAESNGELLGYACTNPFVGRAAYSWSAETTIYLKENKRNMGIGKMLYHTLEEISKAQNIFNLNACIGYPEKDDIYLTKNSVRFHERCGYAFVGKFHNSGYKFGNWYHMVWMEKILAVHPAQPMPVIPFPNLDQDLLQSIGKS